LNFAKLRLRYKLMAIAGEWWGWLKS